VAIQASIFVVRSFIQIREYLHSYKELARKLEDLEAKYHHQFCVVFDAIKSLIHEKNEPRPLIGFKWEEKDLKANHLSNQVLKNSK